MTDTTEGQENVAGVEGGGRSSRGPNPDPGGATDEGGLVPPYDDRTGGTETESQAARAESVERQLHGSPADAGEHAETTLDDDYTDSSTASTPGVRRGEEVGGGVADDESGRQHEGYEGPAQRPVGTSDPRDSTGVNPQENITGGPTQPAGDQGG
jgi:hypothetical protein